MPRPPKKTGTRSRGGESKQRRTKRTTVATDETSGSFVRWDAGRALDPRDARTKQQYGELLGRYDDLPPVLAHQLIESEISGTVRSLRIRDIVPRAAPAQLISGEMAEIVQKRLDALGKDYEPEDYMRVLMTTAELPFNVRTAAAKELMPYRHARRAPLPPEDSDSPEEKSVLIVPGVATTEQWEKQSAAVHQSNMKRTKGSK